VNWLQETLFLASIGLLLLAWLRDRPSKGTQWVLECRSSDGETVGMIDAAIYVLRAASRGDLTAEPVREALRDLAADPEVQSLLTVARSLSGRAR
jgi:hypothetical protein